MKRLMLDTNMVSHLLGAHAKVAEHVTAAPMAALCIPAIREGESRFGVARRPHAATLRAAVRELLRRLDVLPWTSATAQRYGALRADMERVGKPLAPLNLLIAAHALDRDAFLLTNDRASAGIVGLSVEDWTVDRGARVSHSALTPVTPPPPAPRSPAHSAAAPRRSPRHR